MTALQQSQTQRLAELERLFTETGEVDKMRARERAAIDQNKRRPLATRLAALPNPSREFLALEKDAERALDTFEVARTVFQECERKMKETQCACVMARMTHDNERQQILSELLETAPSELKEALEDISFAGELLRCAVRIDETADRNGYGVRVKRVTSNVPAISEARAQLDVARESILGLMQNGTIASTEAVKRGEAIMEAAMVPVFAFVDQRRWDQRRSISASDIVAEVSGYLN